jgi:hypothetical protein
VKRERSVEVKITRRKRQSWTTTNILKGSTGKGLVSLPPPSSARRFWQPRFSRTVEAESNVVLIPAAGPAGTRGSLVGRDFGKRDRVTIDVVGDPGPLAKAWLWCGWRRDRRLFARSPSCAVLVEMDDATREEGCAASSRLQFSR